MQHAGDVDPLATRPARDVEDPLRGPDALRGDAAGEMTAARLQATLGASMKPVPVGVALTRYLTQPQAYRDFVLQWRRTAAAR